MAFCGLFAFVLGYFAGLRFRVAVVLPIEILALGVTIVSVCAGHAGPGVASLCFAIFSVAVQAGYGVALACPLPSRRAVARVLKA